MVFFVQIDDMRNQRAYLHAINIFTVNATKKLHYNP